jgi:membrane protein DedA with SNARE-associated domain
MDIRKFITYTFIGSVPWNALLAYLGWLLGENWAVIEEYAKILDYIIIISLLLLIVSYIIYKRRKDDVRKLKKRTF